MNSRFFSVILISSLILVLDNNATGQFKDKCDLPGIILPYSYDTNFGQKIVDSCAYFKSILQVDTNNASNILNLTLGNSAIYYQHIKGGATFFILHSKASTQVIFTVNNIVTAMYASDSCNYTEIYYDEKGRITDEYYCEYDKPDHCYSKSYSKGQLHTETLYEPFPYCDIKDSAILDRCIDKKAVPVKDLYFDNNGNVYKTYMYQNH